MRRKIQSTWVNLPEICTQEVVSMFKKCNKKDPNSFMHKHQQEYHNGNDPDFEMKVLKSFKDPLSRQVTEAILIKNHQGILLNSKSEFYQPPLVRVRQEVETGLEE